VTSAPPTVPVQPQAPTPQPPPPATYNPPVPPTQVYPAQPYPAQSYPAQSYPALPAPYSGTPYSGTPYSGAPYSGAPAAGYSVGYGAPVPAAPYGVDPMTGQVLSDKSKIVAGLLQLLPGFAFAFGGIGRIYAGQTTLGVIQIVVSVLGWIAFWCGFLLFFVTWIIPLGAWLWAVIDGIVLMAGRPVDGNGRLLRS
jgi:TM2 domain-containing membrane protein YozV